MKSFKYSVLLLLGILSLFFLSINFTADHLINQQTSINHVLSTLGQQPAAHFSFESSPELIKAGKEIVNTGSTFIDGKKTSKQSKHFSCRSCHNVQREDLNIGNPNPSDRLSFAIENKLPFLQATTFWGIVNRETWYNGDYVKKYGPKVEKASKSLEQAIQLCAIECSQGRLLSKNEMNAVMAYFKSLEIRVEDLNLSQKELTMLNAKSRNHENHKDLRDWLKTKYMVSSPATFVEPIAKRTMKGNPKNGKAIYTQSCMHCHKQDGVTNFTLGITKLDIKLLKKNLSDWDRKSIYWITRYGTQPVPGYKPYMPHYTEERMSNQQIEDLAAFVSEYK